MHFSTSTITVAALALAQAAFAAPAADVSARNDPHELDFRTFGAEGCSAENQGVYTLELSQASTCSKFADAIGSLIVTDNLCTLTVYNDDACTSGPVVVPTSICQNGAWQSYRMTC
ncbi:hypothetical protein SCUCBS95973_006458 [Sporothrix curviconia]|uniref:Uncharacterized protein n=1 Tax=Sporothrix curviconia TaxID=1260050 RepID=A0ABP0C5N8_9PEZI